MSFEGPYPYGTPGGTENLVQPLDPPLTRVGYGKSIILVVQVNGRITERLRERIEDVVRVLGLAGASLVAIIIRDDGVVRDANAADVDFQEGILAAQLAPGVVTVNIADGGITAIKFDNTTVPELIRDTIAAALTGSNGIIITPNDVGDTINISAPIPGLVPIGSPIPFTSVNSVPVNGVFSATYKRYVIELLVTDSTAATNPFLRMRNAGSDRTGANYYGHIATGLSNAGPVSGAVFASAAQFTYFTENTGIAGVESYTLSEIAFPFDAARRTSINVRTSAWSAGGVTQHWIGAGFYGAADSNDGFDIIAAAGVMTGEVRVYGKS
jgi:hypothetical protein